MTPKKIPSVSNSERIDDSPEGRSTAKSKRDIVNVELKLTTDCGVKIIKGFSDQLIREHSHIPIVTDGQEIQNLYSVLGINVDGDFECTTNLRAPELARKTESSFQNDISTLASLNCNHMLDTHAKAIDRVCVSPSRRGLITFRSLPDVTHDSTPLFCEFKSRKSNESDTPSTSKELIDVEYDVIQQCIERVRTQSLFRQHLSKMIVLGTTGVFSWCFMLRQNYELEDQHLNLNIICINADDVSTLWKGVTDKVAVLGHKYYLSQHGEYIVATLNKITDVNIGLIRVQKASVSRSTVYYITLPDSSKNVQVQRKPKSFASTLF